ncbi:hypothetical protein MFLAVUS_010528 [Mucor flavus]|uniref:Uncharacterized protein n=1 Tax=Mucor flavus TaxID=439312 RepID=A0ABP9ZCY6_9FUNG
MLRSNNKNMSDKMKSKQPDLSSFFSPRSSSDTSNDSVSSSSNYAAVPDSKASSAPDTFHIIHKQFSDRGKSGWTISYPF